MTNRIVCHSSTPKEDLISFVKNNMGRKIEVCFEYNLYNHWGDDGTFVYNTSNEKEYNDLIRIIDTYYIHEISVLE